MEKSYFWGYRNVPNVGDQISELRQYFSLGLFLNRFYILWKARICRFLTDLSPELVDIVSQSALRQRYFTQNLWYSKFWKWVFRFVVIWGVRLSGMYFILILRYRNFISDVFWLHNVGIWDFTNLDFWESKILVVREHFDRLYPRAPGSNPLEIARFVLFRECRISFKKIRVKIFAGTQRSGLLH